MGTSVVYIMPIVKHWIWLIRKNLAATMLTFVIAARRKRGASLRPFLTDGKACGGYAASVLVGAVAALALSASLPRMKERRIGLITNSAISAAVAFKATATTNTAFQP